MGEKRRFTNIDGSIPQDFAAVFRWGVIDRITGRRRRSPATAPVPKVDPDLEAIASPPGVGEGARLTWLGHASWLVQLEGESLLIDPALQDRIAFTLRRNVPPGVLPEQLPSIHAQLVSHNHYDHLDLPTLRRVGAPVVTGIGLRPMLEKRGLETTELEWWQSTRIGSVTITYVPSQHWSRRGLGDANRTLWGGFVIEGRSARLYHSGDTAYFEGFSEIGRRFPDIDAAMLPIGAYDPAWFMEKLHMNPEQAAQAFVDLGARTFLAMHWGTFKLTDEPLDEPPTRLRAEWQRRGLEPSALRVLAVGESVRVGGLAGDRP